MPLFRSQSFGGEFSPHLYDAFSQTSLCVVDDGHKIPIKLLAKEMVKAVETLSILHARALNLYVANLVILGSTTEEL